MHIAKETCSNLPSRVLLREAGALHTLELTSTGMLPTDFFSAM